VVLHSGLFAPPGTPREIAATLNAALREARASPLEGAADIDQERDGRACCVKPGIEERSILRQCLRLRGQGD